MKAFTHLALLALLFQALAMRQDNAASSASTVTSTPASAASTATPITTSPPTTDTTAPPGTNTSTAANATAPPGTNNTSTTANATAPPGTNTSTTENPTAPPGTNTSAANPTAPPGTNTSAANPTAPPGTNTSAANPTAPPGTNTSTAANATAPPGTNTSTTANPTAPPGTNTSTTANATAPPGTNNTSTAANATAPPSTNTSTAANATAPPGTNTSTTANPTAPPGTNTSAANPTAPPGTNTSTAANATAPPGTNTSTTANPTAPPGTNTSTTANATAPPGTNNTSTAANATAPPSTNTSTAANATAPPGTNTSTTANPTAPPGTNTSAANATAPPGTNTSAANPTAPPGTNTSAANATAPPGTNTSAANPTAPPGTNTSAANPTAPPGTNTSTATTGNTTSNTATSTPTSAGPSTPCKEDSCKDGSLCVNLLDDYVCLCSEGYYYKSSKCNKGKIFPGTIKVKMSYTPEFENKTSKAYQNLYTQVTTFFRDTFNNSDYGQTVIVKVSPSASARSEMRAGNQGVDVAVVNMFTESTKENETSISNAIIKAISTHSRNFSGYDPQDRCDYYGCKKPNDQNDCDSGLLCECKEGLARPNPQIPMCVALGPTCSDMCNAEHKSQCLVRNGSAACVCLPGYKEDDQNTCQACAFGYSGVNCEDSFQLILTILGTIAGVVILGMLIALIVSMRLKNKGRDVEEETLIEKDSQNLRLKETGFSNLGAEGSIFPKVRVNLPRDNESQNPYTSPYTLPDY